MLKNNNILVNVEMGNGAAQGQAFGTGGILLCFQTQLLCVIRN